MLEICYITSTPVGIPPKESLRENTKHINYKLYTRRDSNPKPSDP